MNQTEYLIFLICIIVPIVVIFLLAVIMWIRRLLIINKKGKAASDTTPVDNTEILSFFGGKDNIVQVTKEMSRVTVEVKDIDAVDAQKIKDYGASGVLLVGNNVKCSFPELSEQIYDLLRR